MTSETDFSTRGEAPLPYPLSTLRDHAHPSVSVLGAGKSGEAALEWIEKDLRPRFPTLAVTLRDREKVSATLREKYPNVTIREGEGWLSDLGERLLIRSPGIRPDLPEIRQARENGATLTSEAALFSLLCPAPIFSVTGSDGKTTTASMTAAILRESLRNHGETGETSPASKKFSDIPHESIVRRNVWLGGNIGVPLLPFVHEIQAWDYVVWELSSFQLCDFFPRSAACAWLNLTENHLNWHHSLDEYRAAKSHILPHSGRRVLNADDPVTLAAYRAGDVLISVNQTDSDLRLRRGGCATATYENGALCLTDARGVRSHLMNRDELPLPGDHNVADALTAAALTQNHVSPSDARRALSSFSGVAHRMQTVAQAGGVTFVDSSIDTTPSRTVTTLAAIPGRPTVICGGSDKGVSYLPLARALSERAGYVVLTGATAPAILGALLHTDKVPPYSLEPDFENAVRVARAHTPAGETLVLSPACASFDAFENYAERGAVFAKIAGGFENQDENI